MSVEHVDVEVGRWTDPKGEHVEVRVNAGRKRVEHVTPPAGELHGFDRDVWPCTVNVYVSPTGRSVRVFVDGEEVRKVTTGRGTRRRVPRET